MRRLILLLALVVPTLASAQGRTGTRLDWGTVEILIFPDSFSGMHLDATTRTVGHGLVPVHGLGGGFEPDSVFEWINSAAALLNPTAPPSGPAVMLATPVLRSSGGDSLRLVRRPKGDHWDRRIALVLDSPGGAGDHFDILAQQDEIAALLAGMQREAMLSHAVSRPPSRADSTAWMLPDSVDTPPILVQAGAAHHPTPGHSGVVIAQFVIDTAGRVDPATFRVLVSDDLPFAESARSMIVASRFKPGTIRGQPVRVEVRQRVNFQP